MSVKRTMLGASALLTAALVGGVLAPAHAQEATPEAVSAAKCQAEPRSAEFFQNLAATPAAASEANAATATPEASLEPVDEATLTGITDTAREVVACLNAGDFLRVNALYTDDYLLRNFEQDDVASLNATPSPAAAPDQVLFRGVRDAQLLGDGRVAAVVETTTPTGDIDTYTVFVQSGDRWLIDDESVIDAQNTGDAGAAGTAAAETGAGSGTAAVGAEAATGLEVVSYDIYFEPAELMITANTDVTLTLPNNGVTLHNFSIDELGVDVDIDPGATRQVTINAPAGTYEYYCNVPGHKQAGMKGTLTVS